MPSRGSTAIGPEPSSTKNTAPDFTVWIVSLPFSVFEPSSVMTCFYHSWTTSISK